MSASHFPKQGLHSFLPDSPVCCKFIFYPLSSSPSGTSFVHRQTFNSSPSICTLHAVTSMPFFSKIQNIFLKLLLHTFFQKAFLKIFQIKRVSPFFFLLVKAGKAFGSVLAFFRMESMGVISITISKSPIKNAHNADISR